MLAFEGRGFDIQPIVLARLERVRLSPLDRGVHSFNGRTVEKFNGRNRIGFGNEVPERMWIFIGERIIYRNDFDTCEFQFAVKTEQQSEDIRIIHGWYGALASEHSRPRRTRTMKHLNIVSREPVFVKVKRQAGETDCEDHQQPLFPSHKYLA